MKAIEAQSSGDTRLAEMLLAAADRYFEDANLLEAAEATVGVNNPAIRDNID
jgi:hypothetical protein